MSKEAMLGKVGRGIREFCLMCQGKHVMASTMSCVAEKWSRKMLIPSV